MVGKLGAEVSRVNSAYRKSSQQVCKLQLTLNASIPTLRVHGVTTLNSVSEKVTKETTTERKGIKFQKQSTSHLRMWGWQGKIQHVPSSLQFHRIIRVGLLLEIHVSAFCPGHRAFIRHRLQGGHAGKWLWNSHVGNWLFHCILTDSEPSSTSMC